jgi:hypothetical protein
MMKMSLVTSKYGVVQYKPKEVSVEHNTLDLYESQENSLVNY